MKLKLQTLNPISSGRVAKVCAISLFLLSQLFLFNAASAQTGATIERIQMPSTGSGVVYVFLSESVPFNACASGQVNRLIFRQEDTNFDPLYSMLLASYFNGSEIDVFEGHGDCFLTGGGSTEWGDGPYIRISN